MYRVMTCTLHIPSLPVSDEDSDRAAVKLPGALDGSVHTSTTLGASGPGGRSETAAVLACHQASAQRGSQRLYLVAEGGSR